MVGRTSKSPSLYVKEREITQHLYIYLFYIHLVTFSNINFCLVGTHFAFVTPGKILPQSRTF